MSLTENDALRRFAYEVVQVIQWNQTPQVKVGAICRLARQKKGLKSVEVAKAAGCTQGHYSLLEAGKKRLDSYRTAIDALRLDRAKLIQYVTVSQKIDMAQAEALLLADDVIVANDEEVEDEQLPGQFVADVMRVLKQDCAAAMKAGQICRLTRERLNLTQKTLGSRVGHSNMYISALESGQKPLHLCSPALRALGLDDAKLLTVINEGPTPENTATVEALLRAAIDSRQTIDASKPVDDSAHATNDRACHG